jgi:hypothetical protein
MSELDRCIQKATVDNSSTSAIVENQEIQMCIKQMRVLAVQSVNRDDATLLIAQKCVATVFSVDNQYSRNVYSVALERVLELSSKSSKEINSWFVYSIDEVCHLNLFGYI